MKNQKDFIDVNYLLGFLDGGMRYLESEIKYSLELSNDEKIKNARFKSMLEAYRFIQVHIAHTVEKMTKEISKNSTEENYGIPVNDYKVPTEIRDNVVREFIEVLLKRMEKEQGLLIRDDNNGLYLRNGSICYEYRDENDIRVHGVEVNAAFEALHKAGYFLYGEYCISNGYHKYTWSRKPMFNGNKPLEKPVFSIFID